MHQKTRVAIVGAGSAGLSAVSEIRKLTDDFLLINAGPYGTTCARVACMPSKALIEIANAFHHRNRFETMGIRGADAVRADVPAVLRRVRQLRDGFVSGVVESTEALGDKNVRGRARFLEPNVLEVEGRVIEAERIVLATGSSPVVPEPWQALGNRVFTSDEIFERDDLPRRVAVVGLGAVGLELAQAMARLGGEVTGLDTARTLGGLTDPRVAEVLVETLEREFAVHLGQEAEPELRGNELWIAIGERRIPVDAVLMAVGRRPNLDDLGLEALGVELGEGGVPRFDPETLQVGDLPVFLAGDANGHRPILHEVADEGRIAGYGAVRDDGTCFARRVPLRLTFCSPNAAVAGTAWGQLPEADVVVGAADFGGQGRARMAGQDRGTLRVYASSPEGTVLGAEMAVPAGEHLAHLVAWAVDRGETVWSLLRKPFYHPTYEEGLRSALQDAAAQLEGPGSAELLLCEAAPHEALC
ncbi:MAG: dihydrolipoyl dehydrogenase [Thermodesulfobacteriota bacterium]